MKSGKRLLTGEEYERNEKSVMHWILFETVEHPALRECEIRMFS
jgi:hypothetical protein